nr:T9SS type A sorting domain-containing protein [uncultured Draconibacterium sp.]
MNQQLLTTTHAKVVKSTSIDIYLPHQKRKIIGKGVLLVLFFTVLCAGQVWSQNDKIVYGQKYYCLLKSKSAKIVEFDGVKDATIRLGHNLDYGSFSDYYGYKYSVALLTPANDTLYKIPQKGNSGFTELKLPLGGTYKLVLTSKSTSDHGNNFWVYQVDPMTETAGKMKYGEKYSNTLPAFGKKIVEFDGVKDATIRLGHNLDYGGFSDYYGYKYSVALLTPANDTLYKIPQKGNSGFTELKLPLGGTYKLVLTSKSTSDHGNSFWVNQIIPINNATELQINEVKTGNLVSFYEMDSYKFLAQKGDSLTIKFISKNSSFTPQLYFIDTKDSIKVTTGTKGTAFSQEVVIPEDGYYGLVLCGAADHSSNDYTIQVMERCIDKGIISWKKGSGTEIDPWQINSLSDLMKLSLYVSNGKFFEGKYFALMRDLDMKGRIAETSRIEWMPIGGRNASNAAGMDNYFSGTFDGNGYTLSNLYINNASKNYTGLFGYIKSATIKNLGIIGECNINGGANTGGIVGFANTQSTIANCYSSIATGQVKENGTGGSGGIAGALFGSSIASNCYNKSNVAGGNFIGGIAGWVQDGSLISNCFNTGKVESKSGQGIGGIAGQFSGSTINYCYNTGSVTGGSNLGALAGACYNGTIQNAYFNKTTSVQTKAAGYQSGTNNITATGLTTAEMQDKSLVDKLNQGQSTVWMPDATPQTNNGYPVLLSNATVNTTIITSSPSLVYSFGADLNGYIYVGKNKVTAYGFEFKTKAATQYTQMESTLSGVYLKTEASGLLPGSDYIYRAFAVTASDTLRAEPVNFSTPKCAILTYTRKVGNDGKNTLKFSGNGFHENVVVKLAKAGRDTLVSEIVSSERYNCSALFDFTKKEKGYWDIIVDFKGTTIVIKKGLEIEEAIPGNLKVEIVGNNRALIGRETDYTIKVTNTGNLIVQNPCISIVVDSDDPDFKVYSKDYNSVDKEIFEGLGFDIREFSFMKTENLLDHDRECKIGLFFLPDITAYGSTEIIVSIKSKKNFTLSAARSNYSFDSYSEDAITVPYIQNDSYHFVEIPDSLVSTTKSASIDVCEKIYAECMANGMNDLGKILADEAKEEIKGQLFDLIPYETLKKIAKGGYDVCKLYSELDKYAKQGDVQNYSLALLNGTKGIFLDYAKFLLINVAASNEVVKAVANGTIDSYTSTGLITRSAAKNIVRRQALRKTASTVFKAGVKAKVAEAVGYLLSYSGVATLRTIQMHQMCKSPALKDCIIPDDSPFLNVRAVSSMDPNDKIGYRSPSGSTYFNDKRTNFTYIINFENKSTATAPAHEVFITDTLDIKSFNVSSFRAGYIKIGETITHAPYNVKNHKWEVDLRPKRDIKVEVTVTLDSIKGIAKWYFKTIDPITNDLPSDPDMGFLQPNDSTGRGQGCVSFTIDLNESVTNESEVNNSATIVFDYNAPIMTPTWSNKKDIVAPTSNMFEPDIVGDNKALISWDGKDNKNGSGLFCYNLYMKKGTENYTPLLQRSALTSIDFEFEKDVKYSFYVTAIDSAENEESKVNVPDINLEITEIFAISKKWDDVLVCNNTGSKYTSYQWYKNGNPIQGANEQFYQETGGLNGSYFVMVTTTDGKIGISNVINTGNNTKSVKVYPNPLDESKEYTVEIKAEEVDLKSGEMIITNVNGQLISRRDQLQPLMKLDGLARGVYLIKVQFATGESFNEKLIVK